MTRSQAYAYAQTTLLCAFAAVMIVDPEPSWFGGALAKRLGLLICVAGLLILFSAFAVIRGVIQIAPEPKAGGHLVTAGIYHWLRHPIYTAMAVLIVGLFLRRPTAAVAATAVVVIVFLLIKARFEERLLNARYPDYAAYRSRTWGVIPGLP
jgi:protein-S-isoprenylcysteine O-methyltransferase Ste14